MLGLDSSSQLSRDHILPVILHQGVPWKCQVDKRKHPLYQDTSIPAGMDNPQNWLDLLGREEKK